MVRKAIKVQPLPSLPHGFPVALGIRVQQLREHTEKDGEGFMGFYETYVTPTHFPSPELRLS